MKYRHPWTVNGMPPSLRSTSGLSTSPSLPPPASLLAENAKPHLHPMMHSSPGISVLHSPLLTQQGKSPSWRIGGHWSRASTPSSGAVRLRTCSHPLQVFEPAISCNRTSVRKLILVLLSKQISLLSRST